jgi:hypothetical protein
MKMRIVLRIVPMARTKFELFSLSFTLLNPGAHERRTVFSQWREVRL